MVNLQHQGIWTIWRWVRSAITVRCSYCYEFNELGNKAKIKIDNFVSFFSNVRRYALANDLDSVSFVWHGGEPLLIKLDYYREIGKIQKDIFGDEIRFWNSVQTNLTILTKSHIDFLKSKEFFSRIGVSFDVFGDQRVDIKGALRTDVVLKNMQTLIDQRIGFGAISVLRPGLNRVGSKNAFVLSVALSIRSRVRLRGALPLTSCCMSKS